MKRILVLLIMALGVANVSSAGEYCGDYLAVLEGDFDCPAWNTWYCSLVFIGGGQGNTVEDACQAATDDFCSNYAAPCRSVGSTYSFCAVITNRVMPLYYEEPGSCWYDASSYVPCLNVNFGCEGY